MYLYCKEDKFTTHMVTYDSNIPLNRDTVVAGHRLIVIHPSSNHFGEFVCVRHVGVAGVSVYTSESKIMHFAFKALGWPLDD